MAFIIVDGGVAVCSAIPTDVFQEFAGMWYLERKHSLPTRLFHWTNGPILGVMIWSGLLIYWANDVYRIGFGDVTLFHFFPDRVYGLLQADHRLAEGMAWHFTLMWIFALNGFLYVAFTIGSGEWKHLVPNRHTFAETWQVVRHDLGLRKEPLPKRKFNGTQRLASRRVATQPRVNGQIGLASPLDFDKWRLYVVGSQEGNRFAQSFGLEAIKNLPRVEMTTELKCIEGWSTIVDWAGARFLDFMNMTGLAIRAGGQRDWPDYVSLETPDGAYFVRLDIASALHPQTLLCYEMDGQPLTADHGAPLRLVIPVKYGIKNLKRIGTIRFSNNRPRDYWAELGYDWYAGH